jgi:hypothetical protein
MESQVQRWSAKREVELLLSLVKGERKLVDVWRIDSFSVTSLRFAKLIWRSCGLGVQARVGDLA